MAAPGTSVIGTRPRSPRTLHHLPIILPVSVYSHLLKMSFLHVEGKRATSSSSSTFFTSCPFNSKWTNPRERPCLAQPGHFLTLEPFSVARGMRDRGLPQRNGWGTGEEGKGGVSLNWRRKVHSSTWRRRPTWTKTIDNHLRNVLLFGINLTSVDTYWVSKGWHWRLGTAKVWDPMSRSWGAQRTCWFHRLILQTSAQMSVSSVSKLRPIPLLCTLVELCPFP